jgi:lipoyl-dependent peroxiredoxin
MKTVYEAQATAIGGRIGSAATADGQFRIALNVPKALGGGGAGNNPEQLFAAGYAACFLGSIRAAAEKEKLKIADDANVTATVAIGPREDGEGCGLAVELAADLPGLDPETAQRIVEQAHVLCPYSHATRGNIDVRISVS